MKWPLVEALPTTDRDSKNGSEQPLEVAEKVRHCADRDRKPKCVYASHHIKDLRSIRVCKLATFLVDFSKKHGGFVAMLFNESNAGIDTFWANHRRRF
ncbi:hypothetical protein F2P81_007632 [Scophthalmus maximus]|uniref:Uncharacterized protein n=1 Tax=Scophthalmus maximus TaxID=52904 RepID=A0A6A4T065_SCOMX|nr:hypothetical protein F2P81_007632 [Scophthalmus maximus]